MTEAALKRPEPEPAPRTVLLAGNPNSGKTTLFNALSGHRAKVGNYPGVTVDRRSTQLPLPGGRRVELVDLPGTYSLTAQSIEEEVAVNALLGRRARPPDAVVIVVDATALARGLYVVLQMAETGLPVVVALNMMDEATRAGMRIDADVLSEKLGAEVVPLVASRGEGRDQLLAAIERAAERDPDSRDVPDELVDDLLEVLPAELDDRPPQARRAFARWALLSLGDDELDDIPAPLREGVAKLRERAAAEGRDLEREIVEGRYRRIDELVDEAVMAGPPVSRSLTDRIDSVLLHPASGAVIFAVVMAVLFQTLFAWSDPFIGLIEELVVVVQTALTDWLPEGAIRSLLVEGIVAGVGNVIVFVPQIALLFLFIGILEDTGYLSRVAFVLDRLMGRVGLHGKAFVPMLSGFACAVPAVMATRTIESRRDRLLTMMVVPLTSCSARLPVYVLIAAAVFPANALLFGFLHTGAAVLFSMYVLSVFFALLAAFVLRRTVLRGPRPTLVLELPPYRMPLPKNLLRSTWDRVKVFLVDAGTIILSMTIVLWVLLAYPKSEEIQAEHDQMRAEVPAQVADREARLEAIDAKQASAELAHSFAGRVGKAMEPVIEPFGQDWRIGIGILGAFAAREVFVGTLGIVFGMGETDEESEPLRQELRQAEWPDGRALMTPLSGMALLVFFLLACQCMSTIAVVKRESGTWRWPLFLFAYMSLLAYGMAVLVYQGGQLLGLGP